MRRPYTFNELYNEYIRAYNKTANIQKQKYGFDPRLREPATKAEFDYALNLRIGELKSEGKKLTSKLRIAAQVAREDVYTSTIPEAQVMINTIKQRVAAGEDLHIPSLREARLGYGVRERNEVAIKMNDDMKEQGIMSSYARRLIIGAALYGSE